jgi:alkylhydroperoxidase family enzyme
MPSLLRPLVEPYAAEVAAALAQYPTQNGYLLSLFRTFANSLRFLRKGVPNLLDKASPLALRLREITILRVTARLGCEYEWGVHVAIFASAARLDAAQVAATCAAAVEPRLWTATEAMLIAAIDQLCDQGRMDEATRAAFATAFSLEQQLEILALCGAYHTVSYVANLAHLPPEPFAARFPAGASAGP